MRNLIQFEKFGRLAEQAVPDQRASAKDTLDAYKKDPTVRSTINQALTSNANYSALFNAIKSYWTKQVPYLKNKKQNELTDTESNLLDTIKMRFKNGGTSQEIEEYAVGKILSGHIKELNFNKEKKTFVVDAYTETAYDKSIKAK
jgi:hypothetical protein